MLGFGLNCAIIGGLVGRLIAFGRYQRRKREVDQGDLRDPHADGADRKKDAAERTRVLDQHREALAECDLVRQLMLQAERDGDNEVYAKLAAYRTRLEQNLR